LAASISPVGQTPRSDKNLESLEDEEINEEIEEQLSDSEDLLRSDVSAVSMSCFISWLWLTFIATVGCHLLSALQQIMLHCGLHCFVVFSHSY